MDKMVIGKKRHRIEWIIGVIIGIVFGVYANKLYVSVDNYLNAEPLGYLCKKGVTYIQADPLSTVYIKTENNLECAEEKQQ
jgi:hypothetical protein